MVIVEAFLPAALESAVDPLLGGPFLLCDVLEVSVDGRIRDMKYNSNTS